MKTITKNLMLLLIPVSFFASSFAQIDETKTVAWQLKKVDAYPLAVTFNKTSHLVFSAPIRYVDLGSDYLIAGKADNAENVLRVKSAVADFEGETNFSVITEDGRFYCFDTYYSPYPESLSYNLSAQQDIGNDMLGNKILFEELGTDSPYFIRLLLAGIYKKNERVVKHIGSKSYGMRFLLKGIYIHNGKFYFHTELGNNSHVPFQIDYVQFKIVDRTMAKRTVIQQKPLPYISSYSALDVVGGKTKQRNVFLLDQFTITDDKLFVIEVFEKNGGRHQRLELENSDLVGAKLISEIDLSIQ